MDSIIKENYSKLAKKKYNTDQTVVEQIEKTSRARF